MSTEPLHQGTPEDPIVISSDSDVEIDTEEIYNDIPSEDDLRFIDFGDPEGFFDEDDSYEYSSEYEGTGASDELESDHSFEE